MHASERKSNLHTTTKDVPFSEMAKDESKGKGVDVKSLSSKQYLDQVGVNFELTNKTLPKAQRTRGLSSYHRITVHSSQILNICTISESQISVDFEISTKHQHLD